MKLLNKALLRMSDWSRTTWCLAILMTVAFVLIGRLAQLQVFDTFDLEKKNLLQVQVDRKLQSPRGTIYDRNGKPLAMSVVTKSLYADPKMIKQSPQEIADLISPYVTMSKENIVKALQEDTAFVWLNRMMDADKSKGVQQVIKDNNIAGLNFVEESKRYYPNGVLAAQVLGFVGTDDKGLDGLEMVLDDELKGGVQQEIVATDNKGIFIGIDAILIATGNDWRAIEAGAHAFASRDGRYQGLSRWTLDLEREELVGEMTLPMPVATKGGSIGLNPRVALSHELLGNPSAKELAQIIVSIGLAQNFAALKALVSTGIQQGHMKLQAKSLALLAGAGESEVVPLVERLIAEKTFNLETAQRYLDNLRL